MAKLSVIIPVYNTAKWLPECLDSILSQSFNDYEVICVNDGSTDESEQILEKYSDRITIINQVNSGSGVARNTALSQAKGEYIIFVDSDDWLMENALQKIANYIDENDVDLAIFGGFTFDKNSLRKGFYSVNRIKAKYFNGIFNKNIFKKDIFNFPATSWTKLYRREFLINNDIKFQEIYSGQDQLFFIKNMLLASSIGILNDNLYCYRKRRQGSVTSVKKKTDTCPVDTFWAIESFLKQMKLDNDGFYILEKYFIKASVRLPKMHPDYKQIYFDNYSDVLNHFKTIYSNTWWKYFNPQIHTKYPAIKLEILLCQLLNYICGFSR